ncbi:MAG: peptidylprolyl isomerase [Ignavibacteriales bacterium]|nr:peptidylprolyl isomerase [Ignavibacteriales bacterium]
MTKIRDNLTKAFAVFAVFFIVYIVLDWGMDITGRKGKGLTEKDHIGTVNGAKISFREFSELLKQQTESYKKQTSADPDDETERQLRTQVWNMLVQQALVDKELVRLGISVTDDEIREILLGSNPPEMIAGQFRDSTGTFNRSAYEQAVMNPQNRAAVIQVEEQVRRQRRLEKLQSLLSAATRVTEGEARERFEDQSITMDAEYVLFDPNLFVPDSAVQISDDDLKKYYNANQEEYKLRPARKLKYVFFSLAPSKDDSAAVLTEMTRFAEQAKAGSDFVDLAKTYSEVPVNDTTFFKHGDLGRQRETIAFSARKGEVVGPIADYAGIHLMKILDEKKGTAEFVRASHILLNAVTGPDSVKQIERAKTLLKRVRGGENFGALARENSDDYGSKVMDGDLGWYGRGGWVKPFEQAAFGAKVGDIVGPIRTQFGWHIIKVTGRDSRQLKVATLTMKVKATSQSTDAAGARAQDFAYLAKEEGFEKAAETSAYQVKETPEFVKGSVIPGVGMNDAAMTFAFSKKLNALSEPTAMTGGLAVFKISGVREEGVRPLDEVKAMIRFKVLREKKMQQLKEQVDSFAKNLGANGDLAVAARSIRNVVDQKTGPFKAQDAPPNVGRDLAFVGHVIALKPNEISKPFEGARGYYIVKLLSKSAFDSTQFASTKNTLREQILQEKRNRMFSDWLTALRDKADIEDLRDKFYR